MTATELMADTVPAPGIHHHVPEQTYHSWKRDGDKLIASKSVVWEMERSPAHCLERIKNPKPETDAMKLGSLLDAALLEPSALEKYVVWTGGPRNKNPGKAEWPAWEAAQIAAGKTIIEDDSDIQNAKGMAEAIRAHPLAAELFDALGENQPSIVWRDDATGLLCKGRLDRRCIARGRPTIVELKTTSDARRHSFGSIIARFGYHAQAAAYEDGLMQLTGEAHDHYIVVVEQEPPHGVFVYTLNDQTLQTGRTKWRKCLNRFAECQRSGQWPGYPQTVEVIDVPLYALAEEVTQ